MHGQKKLVRYSVSACRQMVERLDDLLTDEGTLDPKKRPTGLLLGEKDFIKNEIALCRIDFVYWLKRYCFIQHWHGNRNVLFTPNNAQKIILDVWSDLEERQLAIAIINAKARQEGVTTLTEAAVYHRVLFHPNINAVVGSSSPKQSSLMSNKVDLIYDMLSWWMKPEMTSYNAGTYVEFGKQNSAISIQHGSQVTGIARGTTTNCAHLSEVSDFVNPAELIDASLIGAMHESPDFFLVLESTCKGRKNYWHKKWLSAVETWPRTLLRPVFLPWYVARDLYPTETELRRNPVPADWIPATKTQKHAERAKAYVQSWPILRKHLGSDWEMPREQMWWWECKFLEAQRERKLPEFFSEYPADDIEAFQNFGYSVFDTEIVLATRDRCDKNSPLAVFSITGEPCTPRLEPDRRDLDLTMPVYPVTAQTDAGPIKFELLPNKFDGYTNYNPNGRLFVWEFPKPEREYAIGVDTSEGLGQDRAVIQVMRKRDPFNPSDLDEQVAEWVSPDINPHDLWPVCLAIGTMYTTPVNGKMYQPRQVIENNNGGEIVQYELLKLGWWHIHPWQHYDSKHPHRSSSKLGWWTNQRTRSLSVATLTSAVRDEWIVINSPYFVDEMQDFQKEEDEQRIAAIYGGFDDRVMALAFVLFSTYVNEVTTDGKTFFSSMKRRPRQDTQVVGIRPSDLTQQLLTEMGQQRSPYQTGDYNPY